MIVVELEWFHHLFCLIRSGIISPKARQQLLFRDTGDQSA